MRQGVSMVEIARSCVCSRLVTALAAVLVVVPTPGLAQFAPSQGVTVTPTGGSPGTANVTGFDGTVPIFLQANDGWSINASGDSGSVALTGTQLSTTGGEEPLRTDDGFRALPYTHLTLPTTPLS